MVRDQHIHQAMGLHSQTSTQFITHSHVMVVLLAVVSEQSNFTNAGKKHEPNPFVVSFLLG